VVEEEIAVDVVVLVVVLKCLVRLAVSAVMIVKYLSSRLAVVRFCVANVLINKVVVRIVLAVLAVKDVNVLTDRRDLIAPNVALKIKRCLKQFVINAVNLAKCLSDQVRASRFIVMIVLEKIIARSVARVVPVVKIAVICLKKSKLYM